jgi:hypothetical protein
MTMDTQYMDAHPDGWMGRVARAAGKEALLAQRYARSKAEGRQYRCRRAGSKGLRGSAAWPSPSFTSPFGL